MKKFEYRLLDIPAKSSFWSLGGEIDGQELTDRLNALGQEGWEIASSFATNMYEGQSRGVIIVLKREITA